jgi:hypothetical protein
VATAGRRQQTAVAVADAKCAYAVRLPAATEALLRRYAARLPDGDTAEMNRLTVLRTAALRRASAVGRG